MARIEIGPDSNCKRDCAECLPQLKVAMNTDPRKLTHRSNAEAKKMAQGFALQTEQDRQYIQSKLSDHGDAVRARWKKKSKDKRGTMILEAQPTMYLHKWPQQLIMYGLDEEAPVRAEVLEFDTRDTQAIGKALARKKRVKDAFLMPYLNVETLKDDPMKLLSLLHHRSSSKPEAWVMLDVAQMRLGVERTNLDLDQNEDNVIMFGDQYGQLVQWDRAQCHRWNYVGFPRAVLVLEAQAVQMSFLRKMIDLILPMGSNPMGNGEWLSLTAVGFHASGESECWSPFVNQAFSTPPVFDPARCLRNAEAQLAAAEDHLVFLQTEPQYLEDIIAKQLRGEHFAGMPGEQRWSFVASDLMVHPIQNVRGLRNLVDECKHVVNVYKKCKDGIQPGAGLPRDYERALGFLELWSINMYQQHRKRLEPMLRSSPGFHRNHRYVKIPEGRHGSLLRNIADAKRSVNTAYFEDERLYWALLNLSKNPEDVDAIPVFDLFAIIDDFLARSSNTERARIDNTLYDHLARMSMYMEIVTALRSHRPLATGCFGFEYLTREETVRTTWRLSEAFPGNMTVSETKRLAASLKAFYDAPFPHGKRDATWLKAVMKSRSSLSEFWREAAIVREREVTNIGFTRDDVRQDIALFQADQEQHYIDQVADERAHVEALIESQKKAKETNKPSQAMQTVWDGANKHEVELVVGRVKQKTRPHEGRQEVTIERHQPNEPDKEDTPEFTVPVKADSLCIFARMFPSNAELPVKGVVKWQHFVSAMTDAGCSATHTGGSAVSFGDVPTASSSGTIVFHKPHPDLSVDAIMLHFMGKRLGKWFGWESKTFVERNKADI